jgi:LacI family transcriptional regulator
MAKNDPTSSISRVTIHDVARKARVSAQTVSRVINEHPDVSKDTRVRVQRIVHQLRYFPNGIARSLSTQRSGVFGVVASGFQHYGPSQLLRGIELQATQLHWQVMLQIVDQTRKNDYERIAHNLLSQQVDGVIWAYPELTGARERAFHAQIAPHTAIVFLSMRADRNSSVISVDNRFGARLATEHLIERGYKHIAHIAGLKPLWSAQQRKLGWQDALVATGRSIGDSLLADGDWSAQSGFNATLALLKQNPKIDAIFAANDQIALGVIKAATQLGRRVPRDLAVAGFDNSPESAFFSPALTTVHHDLVELGQLGVRELWRAHEARREGKDARTHSLLLQPHLIVRQSS